MVAPTGSAVFRQTIVSVPRLGRRPEAMLLLTVLVAIALVRGVLWLSDNRSSEKVFLRPSNT